jgi:hypothetical protein
MIGRSVRRRWGICTAGHSIKDQAEQQKARIPISLDKVGENPPFYNYIFTTTSEFRHRLHQRERFLRYIATAKISANEMVSDFTQNNIFF